MKFDNSGSQILKYGFVVALALTTCSNLAKAQAPSGRTATAKPVRFHPGHYAILAPMFYGLDENITLEQQDRNVEETFRKLGPKFRGVQIAYTWKILEPLPGKYNLSCISRHLDIARRYNKHLIIQIQTVGFGRSSKFVVPAWLKGSPNPKGGNYATFFQKGNDLQPVSWDPLIHQQQLNLFRAVTNLANHDKNAQSIELINLVESAVNSFSALQAQKNIYPVPNKQRLLELLLERARTLNNGLNHTIGMQYLNFFFGRELNVLERMEQEGISLGFPDLDPDESDSPSLHRTVYPLVIQASSQGAIPTLGAVQFGDTFDANDGKKLRKDNRVRNDRNDVIQTLAFGRDKLKLNYITWYGAGKYLDTVKSVLEDPNIVDQTDPAGGLQKKYPTSIAPFLK